MTETTSTPTVSTVALPKDFARRFHAAQAKVEKAEHERDALVVEARKTAPLREIAKALGVSHTMVAKIERRARR